jgi:class 3 adenylate cyclase
MRKKVCRSPIFALLLAGFLSTALGSCALVPQSEEEATRGVLPSQGLPDARVRMLNGEWLLRDGDVGPDDRLSDWIIKGSDRFVRIGGLAPRLDFAVSPRHERALLAMKVPNVPVGSLGIVVPYSVDGGLLYINGQSMPLLAGTYFFEAKSRDLVVALRLRGMSEAIMAETLAGISVGPARAIMDGSLARAIFVMGLLGVALIVALFQLVNFVMRFKSREKLFFALFIIVAILYEFAAHSGGFFPGVWGLSIDLAARLAFGAFVLFCSGFVGYVAVSSKAIPRRAILPMDAVLALFLATCFLPDFWYIWAEYALWGLWSFISLIVLVRLAISGARGNRESLWLFVGIFAMLAAFLSSRFLLTVPMIAALLPPAALLIMAIIEVFKVARGMRDAFDSVEYLSGYMTKISTSLQRFIPQEFIAYLQKSDVVELELGDHVEKDMTIFFSDLRSFTQLSEQLTPVENFNFINSYLSRVVPVIREHNGFVDKYIGDAIMALFPDSGGADSAVQTAIEMQRKMVEYNGHRKSVGYKPVAMGVGIHTGPLMLGVVGVDDRMESTVISDAVNLSSRLESLTKAFNISLAISEQTFKNLEDPGKYLYRFIGKVKVRGKAAPISVFEIFDGIDESLMDAKMRANTHFEEGMLNFYQKDYSGALYAFRRVLEILPTDGAASFYLDACMAKAAML